MPSDHNRTRLGTVVADWPTARLSEGTHLSSGAAASYCKKADALPVTVMGSNGPIGTHSEANFEFGIIVGRVGACGTVHLVKSPVWASDNTLLVTPKDDFWDIDFLASCLQESGLSGLATKTAQPLLTQSELGAVRIPKPDIPEQRRIVQVLSTVNCAIERTRAVIDQAWILKNALLHRLMSRGIPGKHSAFRDAKGLGVIPKSWRAVSLGELARDRSSVCYGVVQPGNHVVNGIPLLRVCDIEEEEVDISNLKRIAPAISDKYRRSQLEGGELLVTLVGAIGRCAIAPEICRGYNIARAIGKIPLCDDVNPHFVKHALSSIANTSLVGGAFESARKTLNLEELIKVRVPVPDIREQAAIVKIVEGITDKLRLEQKYLRQLGILNRGLSDKLLTGQVRVPQLTEARS